MKDWVIKFEGGREYYFSGSYEDCIIYAESCSRGWRFEIEEVEE